MSTPIDPKTLCRQLRATGQSNPFKGAYSGDLMVAAAIRIEALEHHMTHIAGLLGGATKFAERLVAETGPDTAAKPANTPPEGQK